MTMSLAETLATMRHEECLSIRMAFRRAKKDLELDYIDYIHTHVEPYSKKPNERDYLEDSRKAAELYDYDIPTLTGDLFDEDRTTVAVVDSHDFSIKQVNVD